MKKPLLRVAFPLLAFGCMTLLAGCSGFEGTSFPPASTNPEQVKLGPISGSVFGGHAPIVGAHVYLLQAGTGGYATAASSMLTSASIATGGTYPVAVNTGDPIIPSYGNYYFETTDANGAFNLSGDYTCSTGPNGSDGPPVYIYSFGGSPVTASAANFPPFSVSQVAVSGITGTGAAEQATYTFTLTSSATFFKNEVVDLSAFTGTSIATVLNGQSSAVPAATSNSGTFSLTLPDPSGAYTGTYTVTGTVTAQPNFNPAIVNVAVLGNCPATKNFAGTVSFVYMNEVSTVAAVNALAGFAGSSSPNALNIGSSSTNLQGLLNAGLAANQLYDIQGSVTGNGTNGEGHIARATTPGGNGTVPQKLIDSIANSLAACVDSGNTVNTATASCTKLFATATADGTTAGTKPLDTATAAINLAHNPYSAVTNYATTIFGLSTPSAVPFSPTLAAAPANFSISIAYTGGGLATSEGGAPHSVAIDGAGNVWVVSSNETLSEFSPLGVPAVSGGYTGNGLSNPTSVTIDAQSNYAWVANYGSLKHNGGGGNGKVVSVFTTGGQPFTQYTPTGTGLQDIAFDSSGNAWVSEATTNQVVELSSTGTIVKKVANGLDFPDAIAIQPTTSGDVFIPNANTAEIGVFTQPATLLGDINGNSVNYIYDGYGVAIDHAGKVWTTTNLGYITAFVVTGNTVAGARYSTGTTGGTATTPGTDGIAIDGLGSIWATSNSSDTIYQLSSAGTNQSGNAGYSLTNAGGSDASPDGIAIDGSGNVWFNTSTDATLREMVGSAYPVVTPLAAGVVNNTLGTMP